MYALPYVNRFTAIYDRLPTIIGFLSATYLGKYICPNNNKYLDRVNREVKQRQRRRKRKRHLKIYLYFTCATSQKFQLAQLLKKSVANYPGTKLVGVAYKLRKKIKNSPSCVHILHKTLKCGHVVVFQTDGKEMYQNVKRASSAIAFFS